MLSAIMTAYPWTMGVYLHASPRSSHTHIQSIAQELDIWYSVVTCQHARGAVNEYDYNNKEWIKGGEIRGEEIGLVEGGTLGKLVGQIWTRGGAPPPQLPNWHSFSTSVTGRLVVAPLHRTCPFTPTLILFFLFFLFWHKRLNYNLNNYTFQNLWDYII